MFVTQGLATPGEQMPYLMQGGLGLPEREYYLSADAKMARHARQVSHLCRDDPAGRRLSPTRKAAAGRIMDLETKIAKAHETREESEDFAKGAQVWTRAELEKKAPGLDWGALPRRRPARQRGRSSTPIMPTSIPKLAALVGSEPLQNWKDWLAFHTINQQANVLPKPFRDASFAFYGTELTGTPQQRPRDKLALNATSNALQDAVGKAYVDKYFPASAKAEIQTHGREYQGRLRHAGAGDRLDGAVDQGRRR